MEEKKFAYAYEEIYQPGVKYCPFCEAEMKEDDILCPVCGRQVEGLSILKEKKRIEKKPEVKEPEGKRCNKWGALALCYFFGLFGAHKFYEGKTGEGFLYLFTVGLFGLGWLCDIFIILFKPNPYYSKKKK